jgi:glycosyltransferase involved in cell wall biosynthesis
MKKITLITSIKNAEKLIPFTLESICWQSLLKEKLNNFEYIIVDGASTDKSLDIIQSYAGKLPIKIISESDTGLYDGLAKGFAQATGDIIGYLNAGDYLFPSALDTLNDIFLQTDCPWITAYSPISNNKKQPWKISIPYRFRTRFFENGMHGTFLPTLQQESTFWRADLMLGINWKLFKELKLAGDFYLWQHFSKNSGPPKILHSLIGSFCAHPNQLSHDHIGYTRELVSLCRSPFLYEWPLAFLDKLMRIAPVGLKKRIAPRDHIIFDPSSSSWRYYEQ